jgi:2-haloacid dehalogenase
MSVIVFDVIGTLIDLRPLGGRLGRAGLPETALDAWFERTLHHAACVTLAGDFAPFADLARAALETMLIRADVDPSTAGEIMEPLTSGTLPAYADAAGALSEAHGAARAVAALTNGSAAQTEVQLRSVSLEPFVDRVLSVEQVAAYKPHPSVYRMACEFAEDGRPVLISAHAWDVFGARAAGMDAVWVRRAPAPWPFPGGDPRTAPDLTRGVRAALRETA